MQIYLMHFTAALHCNINIKYMHIESVQKQKCAHLTLAILTFKIET